MKQGFFATLLVITLLCTTSAFAQQDGAYIPFPEDVYISQYFGTTLVVFMTEQLNEDPTDWWGNALPDEFFYDQMDYCELVNVLREETGEPLLDTYGWYIELGDEKETDGGWEYEIRFLEMRPAEVMLILAEMGGADALFPNGQFSFMPCLARNIYADSIDAAEPFTLRLAMQDYTIDSSLSIAELYEAVDAAFTEAYEQQVYFDLYVNGYMMQDGSTSRTIDVYAELPAG